MNISYQSIIVFYRTSSSSSGSESVRVTRYWGLLANVSTIRVIHHLPSFPFHIHGILTNIISASSSSLISNPSSIVSIRRPLSSCPFHSCHLIHLNTDHSSIFSLKIKDQSSYSPHSLHLVPDCIFPSSRSFSWSHRMTSYNQWMNIIYSNHHTHQNSPSFSKVSPISLFTSSGTPFHSLELSDHGPFHSCSLPHGLRIRTTQIWIKREREGERDE